MGNVPFHGAQPGAVSAAAYESDEAGATGAAGRGGSRSVLQNTPAVNLDIFPEPRLQTNDAGEMSQYVNSEQELLNPEAAVCRSQWSDTYSDIGGDAVDRGPGIAGASECAAA